MNIFVGTGEECNVALVQSIDRVAPFQTKDDAWFLGDMDGDGLLNGPSDWDTDGDGMPDGFEYCYSHLTDLSDEIAINQGLDSSMLLDPANASDAYGDWDEDGLNNLEEYLVAESFGPSNFTSRGALIPTWIKCPTAGNRAMVSTHVTVPTAMKTLTETVGTLTVTARSSTQSWSTA